MAYVVGYFIRPFCSCHFGCMGFSIFMFCYYELACCKKFQRYWSVLDRSWGRCYTYSTPSVFGGFLEDLPSRHSFPAFLVSISARHIIIIQERCVLYTDVTVEIEEVRGTLTGHRLFGMGARQGELIEDGLVAAQEAVLLDFAGAVGPRNCVAHMEDLTVVVHVSIVAVALAAEARRNGAVQKQVRAIGQLVGLALLPSHCRRSIDSN